MSKQNVKNSAVACHDHQRRTCLQVARDKGVVKFIPLDIDRGLVVDVLSDENFDRRYRPMVDYPVEKAAQLYLCYSQTLGATKEALDALSHIIPISDQEINMAIKKQVTRNTDGAKAKPEPKAKAKAAPVPKSTPKPKAEPKPKAKPEGKKVSAAQMFQDLIMAGKLTDDQIFAKVQEAFGLDEKKRGYVKWYRNHLIKQGKTPPAAK